MWVFENILVEANVESFESPMFLVLIFLKIFWLGYHPGAAVPMCKSRIILWVL